MTELLGRIVTSRAGRDKGRSFVVMSVCDDAHLWIADGRTHKAAHPKKKKLMHLHFEPQTVDMGTRPEDVCAVDAWLRRSLAALGYDLTISKEG